MEKAELRTLQSSRSADRHRLDVENQFARWIKQAAVQIANGQRNIEFVLDIRDRQGPRMQWEDDRIIMMTYMAGESNMAFAGWITELGYQGAPKTYVTELDPLFLKQLRFVPMDDTIWENEWLEQS
jgi:hypothetical protein